MSIDECEDEDVSGEVLALPFVISEDLAEQYGNTFNVTLDENQVPSVEAVS